MSIRTGAMRERLAMHNANVLKIGLFGANCSSARTATLAPERWLATWPDCLKLARMADAAGCCFFVPVRGARRIGGGKGPYSVPAATHTFGFGFASWHPPCSEVWGATGPPLPP